MTFLQPINQQNIKEFYTFHKEVTFGAYAAGKRSIGNLLPCDFHFGSIERLLREEDQKRCK